MSLSRVILILVCLVLNCCRGPQGESGNQGEVGNNGEPGNSAYSQTYEGTIPESPWNVLIQNFDTNDILTIYFSYQPTYWSSLGQRDPDDPNMPFYEFTPSGTDILVQLSNLPTGSHYRIVVVRYPNLSTISRSKLLG